MKGVLSHTREDTLSWSVLVVSFLYMNCIWLHACLALKRKEKSNHALKPITCCTFDIIFYLSKNYLTRSPSWDEHISFSRVSWPTSRHQVNTLFQFQYSNRDKLTYGGLLNGSGLKFILQEFDRLLKVNINCLIPASVSQVTHTSPADVLMDTFKMSNTKTIKETKDISFSVTCHVYFVTDLHRIITGLWTHAQLYWCGIFFI